MPQKAEFGRGYKIHFWNGKEFIKAEITNTMFNPITKGMEYTVFFRTDGKGEGKRRRNTLTIYPHQIRESEYFTDPKNTK